MARYIRLRRAGGIYFFTVVTHNRRPFLVTEHARSCLRQAWEQTQRQCPFDVIAVCVLPDHLHCIWELPEGDDDFPKRWQELKSMFTRTYLRTGGEEGKRTALQQRKGERAVFQPRYYEHCIRDDEDLRRHFDYTHYNPVKHGFAKSAAAWPWSTFHRYARMGWYDADWGLSPDTPDMDLE
jgi:putative transposase